MRIDRLHIDAYGRFEEFDLSLGSGLNLLYGVNEAGKTTLVSFVRAMLFGFEKRKGAVQYEPVDARPGGFLQLATQHGSLRVQRTLGRRQDLSLYGQEGEPLAAEKLVEALAGVSRDLFFEVFAFGLHELSAFERLASESSVSEALFASGVQGARRFPEAMARLRKSTEKLYSQRGKKPLLNTVLAELATVQDQLCTLGTRPQEYFEKRRQVAELEKVLETLEEQIAHLREDQATQQALAKNAKRLVELDAAGRRFGALESFAEFPLGADDVLEERLTGLREAQARKEDLERQIRALDEVATDAPLHNRHSGGSPAVPLTLPSGPSGEYQEMIEVRRQLTQMQGALTSVEAALASARKERERVEQRIRQLSAEQQPLPTAPIDELQRLLSLAHSLPRLDVESRALESIREEKERTAADLRGRGPKAPQRRFRLALYALALAGALGTLVIYLFGGLFLGIAAMLVFSAATWWARRRYEHAIARERARVIRLLALEEEVAPLEQRQQRLRASLDEAVESLGLTGPPSGDGFSALVESLQGQIKRAERRLAIFTELDKESAELVLALGQEQQAQADRDRVGSCLRLLEADLSARLDRTGIPYGLSLQDRFEAWKKRADRSERLAILWVPYDRACESMGKAQRAVAELLALGRATSVEEFREQSRRASEWRKEQRSLHQMRQQLEGQAATTVDQLRERVAEGDGTEGLARGADQLSAQLQDAASEKRRLTEQLGGLRQQLSEWEKDPETSNLRALDEALRTRACRLVERYAVDRLATKLLAQAREDFHARYQPELILRASAIFSEFTLNRYAQIFLEPGVKDLLVRDRVGTQRKADALSRGTREQLYLAFRIAVIEDYSRRLCPLPVLLDDILVNFDRRRTEAAVRVFARLAQEQQVIAFTCHEHIREQFRHHGATCTELGGAHQSLLRLHTA